MINLKNKKAAMEMSMGTIVTIVLLMSVLVLGIFMVQNIFDVSDKAIGGISTEMETQINTLFNKGSSPLVMLPISKQITIERGDTPAGFMFNVKNDVNEKQTMTYTVSATDETAIKKSCGAGMTIEKANDFLLTFSDSFPLGAKKSMSTSELILLEVPSGAPACTIVYKVSITGDQGFIETGKMYVTIE